MIPSDVLQSIQGLIGSKEINNLIPKIDVTWRIFKVHTLAGLCSFIEQNGRNILSLQVIKEDDLFILFYSSKS